MFSGVRSFEVDASSYAQLASDKELQLPDDIEYYPNEFFVCSTAEHTKPIYCRIFEGGTYKKHKGVSHSLLSTRNLEQSLANELLYDDEVPLVTLTGRAGTGKTLLAVAAGIDQLDRVYDRMLITRPVVTLGKDIGYLPGTKEEKMEPWIAPIKDNLRWLLKNKKSSNRNTERELAGMFEQGRIEIDSLAYLRGRSLPNTYMIVDEAQNLDLAMLKSIITRIGENSKLILTGDTDQIDQKIESGLLTVIERFKVHRVHAHVSLIKGERSEVATLASSIL